MRPSTERSPKQELRARGFGGRRRRNFWPVFFLALLLAAGSCSSGKEGRGSPAKNADYSAAIRAAVREISASAGETADITLRVENTGRREWRSAGLNPCFLSYHLLDRNRKVLRFDNPRTPLPGAVQPGETAEVLVRVKGPLEQGDYLLEFDLVREGVAWFKDGGGRTLAISLADRETAWPEDGVQPGLAYGRYTSFRTDSSELESLRRLIRLTLHHDEVGFAGKTGRIEGFAAGAGYPQIWLRDAATIIPASRFYYPEGFLASWIEEHLACQAADGALQDWIDAAGRSDKNTVETDQETSAVQAAYQVFLLRGVKARDWLLKPIAGEPAIDRLERALRYPFARRFSEKFGLLTGAHTADWGDVDPEDADQQAIYVDEKTHWTADIYDQAMAFQACRELAVMLRSLGRRQRAVFWETTADDLKKRTDGRLWQKDKGFYRVHVHLKDWPHAFAEDDMFAMGGNAQAIVSGLADRRQAENIIETALARQERFHVSTIGGSLLPPYPPGFFKHPQMDEAYEYQNGGQWDWFGGRLILGMFENGFARDGLAKLVEIIRKDLGNDGLYEWDARDGSGRGSDFYAGSAGSLARALYEGYFGFRLGETGLSLEPELRSGPATAHFYLPAADIFAAYDYEPNTAERRITLLYNSNDPRPGRVKILIPWELFGLAGVDQDRARLTVLRDGATVPFVWARIRRDDSIVIDTDFKDHRLEIRLAARN
jgi:hypothetical protein